MHEHHEDDPEVLSEIEKLGYDPRDVPVDKRMLFHAAGLFLGVGAAMFLAWIVMAALDRSQAGGKSIVGYERPVSPEDPYPLLQSNTAAHKDIADLRHKETVKTSTAGWVDKERGVAHIPIELAKELVLREGIKSTGNTPAPALGVAPEGHVTEGPTTGGGE